MKTFHGTYKILKCNIYRMLYAMIDWVAYIIQCYFKALFTFIVQVTVLLLSGVSQHYVLNSEDIEVAREHDSQTPIAHSFRGSRFSQCFILPATLHCSLTGKFCMLIIILSKYQ